MKYIGNRTIIDRRKITETRPEALIATVAVGIIFMLILVNPIIFTNTFLFDCTKTTIFDSSTIIHYIAV